MTRSRARRISPRRERIRERAERSAGLASSRTSPCSFSVLRIREARGRRRSAPDIFTERRSSTSRWPSRYLETSAAVESSERISNSQSGSSTPPLARISSNQGAGSSKAARGIRSPLSASPEASPVSSSRRRTSHASSAGLRPRAARRAGAEIHLSAISPRVPGYSIA